MRHNFEGVGRNASFSPVVPREDHKRIVKTIGRMVPGQMGAYDDHERREPDLEVLCPSGSTEI
jgi:hypothetical protein